MTNKQPDPYATKNHGKITFHKILCAMRSLSAYDAIHNDLAGIDLSNPKWGLIGTAVEDFMYGKQDLYVKVERTLDEDNLAVCERDIEELEEKAAKNKAKGKPPLTQIQSAKYLDLKIRRDVIVDALTKIQLTTAEYELVEACAVELGESNNLGIITGTKEYLEIDYKGMKLCGEVDELILDGFEARGMKFKACITDIKTTAGFDAFENYLPQYLGQLAFYQFLACIKHDLEPIEVCGVLKVVSKEKVPRSKVFLVLPVRMKENWSYWIDGLDTLVETYKAGSFPELTWKEGFAFPEIYHLNKQEEYILL